jgi:hypothetical protein
MGKIEVEEKNSNDYFIVAGTQHEKVQWDMKSDMLLCGEFRGTIANFAAKIEETHKNNPAKLEEYRLMFDYFRKIAVLRGYVQDKTQDKDVEFIAEPKGKETDILEIGEKIVLQFRNSDKPLKGYIFKDEGSQGPITMKFGERTLTFTKNNLNFSVNREDIESVELPPKELPSKKGQTQAQESDLTVRYKVSVEVAEDLGR